MEESAMPDRKGLVTMKGDPLTLTGKEVKPGDKAPKFTVLDNGMKPVSPADFTGKVVVLASVPSLDTPVCDLETRRFNQEAAALGSDVAILTVSMDLPFAQKRWCGAAGIDRVVTLSDHREASFGKAFGVLIKENRLLARAVFVLDRGGVVRYAQIVPEIGREPEYAPVLEAVRRLL
jgi:thioredoxin-dependent peroxiredoxin